MVVNQLKVVALVLLAIGLGAAGMTVAAHETLAARPAVAGTPGQPHAATSAVPRAVPAPPEKYTFVDLQPQANQKLKDPFGSGRDGNDLASLRTGPRTLLGVNFKVGESVIQLGSKFLKEQKPTKVEGIKVGSTVHKLHILHSTGYGRGNSDEGQESDASFIKDGTRIAEYVVRYEDGKTETIPVVYGEDVRDWWFREDEKGPSRGKVAWKAANEAAKKHDCGVRLYLTTWKNPRPDKKVVSIDYVGRKDDTAAAPFCVAITAEEK